MAKFEWDLKKADENKRKHKISFEEAITAFDDPFALIASDKKHSTSQETREWLIGEAVPGILVIVFTLRESKTRVRIISARKANRKEKKLYEETKRIPI